MKFISSEGVVMLITVSAGFLILYLTVRSIKSVISRVITEPAAAQNANRALIGAGFTLALFYLIFALSNKLDVFALLLGAIGAGLTFSLQQVILCLIGWLAITIGQLYQVGDRISLDGVAGDVLQIGLFKTSLVDLGDIEKFAETGESLRGVVIQIPNCKVLSNTYFNLTQLSPYLWDELVISLDHKSSLFTARDLIKKIIRRIYADYQEKAALSWQQAARKYPLELSGESFEPQVFLEVDEQGLHFRIRYLVYYRQRRMIRDAVYSALLSELSRAYGQVIVAQQIIRLDDVPLVRVQSID